MSTRPLVSLDVDGVINNIEANLMLNRLSGPLDGRARRLGVDIVQVRGRRMAVPHHMPSLIRRPAAVAEVWWCTTWRSHANGELTDQLGVAPFPVLDPDGHEAGPEWKAREVAAAVGDRPQRPAIRIEDSPEHCRRLKVSGSSISLPIITLGSRISRRASLGKE